MGLGISRRFGARNLYFLIGIFFSFISAGADLSKRADADESHTTSSTASNPRPEATAAGTSQTLSSKPSFAQQAAKDPAALSSAEIAEFLQSSGSSSTELLTNPENVVGILAAAEEGQDNSTFPAAVDQMRAKLLTELADKNPKEFDAFARKFLKDQEAGKASPKTSAELNKFMTGLQKQYGSLLRSKDQAGPNMSATGALLDYQMLASGSVSTAEKQKIASRMLGTMTFKQGQAFTDRAKTAAGNQDVAAQLQLAWYAKLTTEYPTKDKREQLARAGGLPNPKPEELNAAGTAAREGLKGRVEFHAAAKLAAETPEGRKAFQEKYGTDNLAEFAVATGQRNLFGLAAQDGKIRFSELDRFDPGRSNNITISQTSGTTNAKPKPTYTGGAIDIDVPKDTSAPETSKLFDRLTEGDGDFRTAAFSISENQRQTKEQIRVVTGFIGSAIATGAKAGADLTVAAGKDLVGLVSPGRAIPANAGPALPRQLDNKPLVTNTKAETIPPTLPQSPVSIEPEPARSNVVKAAGVAPNISPKLPEVELPAEVKVYPADVKRAERKEALPSSSSSTKPEGRKSKVWEVLQGLFR